MPDGPRKLKGNQKSSKRYSKEQLRMLGMYLLGAVFVGLLGGVLQLSEFFGRPKKRRKLDEDGF
jgi:hypothetical protein